MDDEYLGVAKVQAAVSAQQAQHSAKMLSTMQDEMDLVRRQTVAMERIADLLEQMVRQI